MREQFYKYVCVVLLVLLAFFSGVGICACSMREYAAEALKTKNTAETTQEKEPELIVHQYCDVENTTETPEIEETTTAETEAVTEPISLGVFTVTAYCDCSYCCDKDDGITATGTQATEGRTIAVDPNVIPYGTEVIIDGHTYIAEDCGGAIDGNHIDMFFYDHSDARAWGVQEYEIFIEG